MFFFFFYKDEVENFLKQSLYSRESLEIDKVFGDYIVDFYLPIRQALLRCSRIGVKMSFVGSLVLCRKY